MTDLEQKAREVWDRITKQRQMIQGGYEVPYEEPLPSGLILQALRDVREADAQVAEAEPEPEGPIPEFNRRATIDDPELSIRAAVRVTKQCIAAAIRRQGVK